MHRHTRLIVEKNGPKGWEIVSEETCSLTLQKPLSTARDGAGGTPAARLFEVLLLAGWDVRLTSEEIRCLASPVPADAAPRPNTPAAV